MAFKQVTDANAGLVSLQTTGLARVNAARRASGQPAIALPARLQAEILRD